MPSRCWTEYRTDVHPVQRNQRMLTLTKIIYALHDLNNSRKAPISKPSFNQRFPPPVSNSHPFQSSSLDYSSRSLFLLLLKRAKMLGARRPKSKRSRFSQPYGLHERPRKIPILPDKSHFVFPFEYVPLHVCNALDDV